METLPQVQEKPDIEAALKARANAIVLVKVVDAETFEQASATDKELREVKKSWEGYWEKIKKSAHETWKGIVSKEKALLDIVEKKQGEQKALAKVWADEEERKRVAAQKEADEKARKEAEDAQLLAAQELEAQGDKEGADAVLDAPPPIAAPVVTKTVPAGHGGMIQKYYSASVVDIKALAKAVLEGKVPVQAIQGNEVFLNGQARMLKETMSWPGVKVSVR